MMNLSRIFVRIAVLIAILFFVSLFVIISGLLFGNWGNGADGIATDSIARVSYGGWIWKTWRLELTNDHPSEYSTARYGIENNPSLISQLERYAASGERVKLYYHSHIFVWNWEYSDAEVIYKVESIRRN